MTLGYIGRSSGLSHVPLWSKTPQEFQVYLSFILSGMVKNRFNNIW